LVYGYCPLLRGYRLKHARRIATCYLTITVFLSLLLAVPLNAHAILSPLESTASKIEIYRLTVFGENLSLTDFSPTVSVIIEIPKGFDLVEVINITGWNYEVSTENGTLKIIWSGYLPLGRTSDLLFKLKNPDIEGSYEFRVFQRSLRGTIILWNEWNYSGIHGSSYLTVRIARTPPATLSTNIFIIIVLSVIALTAYITIKTVRSKRHT